MPSVSRCAAAPSCGAGAGIGTTGGRAGDPVRLRGLALFSPELQRLGKWVSGGSPVANRPTVVVCWRRRAFSLPFFVSIGCSRLTSAHRHLQSPEKAALDVIHAIERLFSARRLGPSWPGWFVWGGLLLSVHFLRALCTLGRHIRVPSVVFVSILTVDPSIYFYLPTLPI